MKGAEAFGKRLADEVLKLAATIRIDRTKQKETELLASREEFKFPCTVEIANPQIQFALGKVFFPGLIGFFVKEYKDGVRPTVTVALLDRSLGFVGVSGSCSASTRIRFAAAPDCRTCS